MNKKFIFILISVVILFFCSLFLYNYLRVKNAKIEVKLIDDLTLEFNTKKKVSDYITSINGKIIDNYIIDSTKLGNKKISFEFINNDNIRVSYVYNVNVVDNVKPLIWLGSSYKLAKGTSKKLEEIILCGDNYDSNPICYVEGNYDVNTVGSYDLVFKAVDNSGNTEEQSFTLNVYEPDNTANKEKTYTSYNDVIKNYKTDKNKIGIDISSWQGDIDFSKLKDAGVEFIMIRVGGTRGTNGEYFLDKNFEKNIKQANKYGIEVGIYFYSYANSVKTAKRDANWVLKQIKKYDVNLPIAFDWEEWDSFNEYNLSFFDLTSIADEFLNVIEEAGYTGMLYSSKSYLEKIWMNSDNNIWLAHYTSNTDYKGKYKMWQICNTGNVDGINGDVDIDIMY